MIAVRKGADHPENTHIWHNKCCLNTAHASMIYLFDIGLRTVPVSQAQADHAQIMQGDVL